MHFRNRDLHTVLGRWTRQEPLGYVDGGNVFLFARASPILFVAPSGTTSYGGHHIVPRANWESKEFSEAVKRVFDTVVDHGADHQYDRAHRIYSSAVGDLFDAFMDGKCPSDITEDMAKQFLDSIRNSNDPYIRGYLSVIGQGAAK